MSHNRIAIMYFFASLSFLVAGLGLCLITQRAMVPGDYFRYYSGPWPVFHPFLDLGLRLFGFGIFLVAATFYQSLGRQKRGEPLKGNTFGLIE